MAQVKDFEHGFTLPCGAKVIHGTGANIKYPFNDIGIPVEMHEFSPDSVGFSGQLGFIEFSTDIRLPRHVHMGPVSSGSKEMKFLAERILVLNGTVLVELCGELYVIPPKTLVNIPPGDPHTWTACPAGVDLEAVFPADVLPKETERQNDRHGEGHTILTGKFLMVYEDESPRSFSPTKQLRRMVNTTEYERCLDHQLRDIMIPSLRPEQVLERCWLVWGREVKKK